MRDVSTSSITDAFLATIAPSTPPRLREVLTSLVRHLHDFARETKLTHAEWRAGIALLTASGAITTEERNEFVLWSDVLGLSSLVDLLDSPAGATPSSVLGPFHILGAPMLAVGGDLRGDHPGEPLVVSGVIRRPDGTPVEGAVLEIWQTAANGLYSNQDPDQAPYDFRARMVTGSDGRYLFSTVRPAPYTVPTDGPVGELLRGVGRLPWRPSHLHVIVQAPGLQTLVTELFPSDDPWLDQDAVFGVRTALVLPYTQHTDRAALPPGLAAADRLPVPFTTASLDLVLANEKNT
jgi:hydroxyquinol 1,2-dioxygenase